MRRCGKLVLGLGLVLAGASPPASRPRRRRSRSRSWAKGPAYEQVGKLAVMHAGRIKPLDTVAREEVKQIFGRETIKLHDARNGEVVETWGPVGAFFDWSVRPEFWDDQPFILVDYLPLQAADPGRARSAAQLKAIAARDDPGRRDRDRA